MKTRKKISVLVAAMLAVACFAPLVKSENIEVSASPAASKVITTPTGYDSADDVVYKKSGKIVANWGARGEDCVFLSSYADSFYSGNYEYEVLSKKLGSSTQSSVPSSALYKDLHNLMESKHTFFTYYDGNKNVRDYYKYSECVSNDTTQVALFYRGGFETSDWNQGNLWNQEHTWPQSKLSTSQQIGDLMHLRSTNPSENSTRGNKPYGNSGTCYDPGVSVRGDCARTMLYMYVRWELSNQMWGTTNSKGVFPNFSILLDWMEQDPVDTWEMGRNDAVQTVTGTRNVFVDYPEYAWLLFGQEIPDTLLTPSGNAMKNDNDTPSSGDSSNSSSSQPPELPDNSSNSSSSQEPELPDDSSSVSSSQKPELPETDEHVHDFSNWITFESKGIKTRMCYTCGITEKVSLNESSEAENSGDSSSENAGGTGVALNCGASIKLPILLSSVAVLGCTLVLIKRKKQEE